MVKFFYNITKSILIGIAIMVISFFTMGFIFNDPNESTIIIGIAIISTILYCTYTIIDTIKEYCDKE